MSDEKSRLGDGYEICEPIARDGDAATLTATYTASNGIKLRIDENADADGNDEDGVPFDPGTGEFLPTNEQAIWLAGRLLAWAMHDHGHKPANPRMTAARLAALLLEHPDAEVILEDADTASIMSAEAGKPCPGGYHRATGIEAGHMCILDDEIDSDLTFAIPATEPERYGVRAVRIMGYASMPTPPNRVLHVDKTGSMQMREASPDPEAPRPTLTSSGVRGG